MVPAASRPKNEDVAFSALLRECEAQCLWFWDLDKTKSSAAGKIAVLEQIEKHGTVDQFVRARNIKKCLLRNSREESAVL